ncbi:hypothetical protein [Bacillus manliponensis]|uniref:hypothetical protein n=1 Tax=Bacillus manliponensis TaxID=574376 RepID=UPI003511B418
MQKDFTLLIADEEKEKEELITQMEDTKVKFKQAVITYAKDWFRKQAKLEITDKPRLAKRLGAEQLRNLKKRIEDLINQSEQLVDEYLDDNSIWWHLSEKKWIVPYNDRIPGEIHKAVKLMFGELGVILAEAGFVELNPIIKQYTSGREHNLWVEDDIRRRPCYPYPLSFTSEIKKIYTEYHELAKRTEVRNGNIKKLQAEKEESHVGDLWDSL